MFHQTLVEIVVFFQIFEVRFEIVPGKLNHAHLKYLKHLFLSLSHSDEIVLILEAVQDVECFAEDCDTYID